ncbi:DUF5690 family protein [Crateriforma spongiae]|uniref:DUF5690 family protein n=1 Tax=Crateriforma spongiae TaxID=2724528 RepID=UPI0039AFCB82
MFQLPKSTALEAFLRRSSTQRVVPYAMAMAFATYFCMYAFRKPFAAGTYDGLRLWGLELKTALVISQILGYTLSKYLGIKYCSEAIRRYRAAMILSLIGLAELALLLFAVLPLGLKPVAMFFNGLPLGMIWGLIVWYLEGRRTSEILLAGLSCSFIVSSGVVKDVGLSLMDSGVSEWFMPFATGMCFFPLLIICVWLLDHLPEPSAEDIAQRVRREPMSGAQRMSFVRSFAVGLGLLLAVYFFQTAYRDYRDNYQVDILQRLGYGDDDTALLSRMEIPVAFGVMICMGALTLVRDNRRGLAGALGIMIAGAALTGVSTLLMQQRTINGFWWMTLVGLGSYLTYVPFNSVLFDRLIAATGFVGTAVFCIYVADSLGYSGSVAIQIFGDVFATDSNRLEYFVNLSYCTSAIGVILSSVAGVYFWIKSAPSPAQTSVTQDSSPNDETTVSAIASSDGAAPQGKTV